MLANIVQWRSPTDVACIDIGFKAEDCFYIHEGQL